jgi:hypothetical protein
MALSTSLGMRPAMMVMPGHPAFAGHQLAALRGFPGAIPGAHHPVPTTLATAAAAMPQPALSASPGSPG